jgi:hypothetical protein
VLPVCLVGINAGEHRFDFFYWVFVVLRLCVLVWSVCACVCVCPPAGSLVCTPNYQLYKSMVGALPWQPEAALCWPIIVGARHSYFINFQRTWYLF